MKHSARLDSLLHDGASFATRVLSALARMLNLREIKTIIAGVQPDIALTTRQPGLTLEGVGTVLDPQTRLAILSSLPEGK